MSIAKSIEVELIGRAVKGDADALVTLWDAYRPAFKSFVRAYLKRSLSTLPTNKVEIREEDVDEIISEAFDLLISKKIRSYKPDKSGFFNFVTKFVLAQDVIRKYIDELIKKQYIFINTDDSRVSLPMRPHISDRAETFTMFRTIFALALNDVGYPHQQIVFGFIKLLQWGPKEVVAELSDKTLYTLTELLAKEIIRVYDDYKLLSYFEPLNKKMSKSIKDVIPAKATKTRRLITVSSDTKIGDTILPHYWGKRPEANISNWVNDVSERISKAMLEVLSP